MKGETIIAARAAADLSKRRWAGTSGMTRLRKKSEKVARIAFGVVGERHALHQMRRMIL